MTFGILRNLIGNRQVQGAHQYPAHLSVFRANQIPIIHCDRARVDFCAALLAPGLISSEPSSLGTESSNQLSGGFGAGGAGGEASLDCEPLSFDFRRAVRGCGRTTGVADCGAAWRAARAYAQSHPPLQCPGSAKTGRTSIWFRVDVQWLKHRGRALRRILRRALRHAAEPRHLFRREKLPIVRPSLGPLRRTHLHESPLVFQNLQLVSVFDCRGHRRLRRQFLTKQQRGGSNVGCADRTRLALRGRARNQKDSK